MRQSCCGWCDDSDGAQLIMNAMLAEGVQVVSVTDGGHLAKPRFHVFGIAEEECVVGAVRDRIIQASKKMGLAFQENQ